MLRRGFTLAVRRFHCRRLPPAAGAVPDAILAAAYRHVPGHGFSRRALGLGARDAGFLDISPGLLADGVFGLIRHHLVAQRQALVSRGPGLLRDRPALGVDAAIAALAWARLMANEAIVHHWQHALAIMAQPSYVAASLRELALLSDDICFVADHRAVDPSWYSTRASLSVIYAAAELFMTNDKSPAFADTRNFLNTRLADAKAVGRVAGALRQWAGFTMDAGTNVLRSRGLRI